METKMEIREDEFKYVLIDAIEKFEDLPYANQEKVLNEVLGMVELLRMNYKQ